MNYLINELKKKQFKKYSSFNIPDDVLENSFNNSLKKYTGEVDIITYFNRLIEKYIVDEIKKDNIDMHINVINYYSNLKTRIKINKKYDLPNNILNDAYDKAIEMLKDNFDNEKSLYINILNNMKNILTKQNSIKENKIELYDISFMHDYIKYYDINKKDLMKLFNCDKNKLNKIIEGKELIDKEILDDILQLYNFTKIEELKDFIKDELERYQKKQLKKQKKKINNKYDISFMKDYLNQNNISKNRLAQILEVNYISIDNILNGTYLISDDRIKALYNLFNVDSYDKLKERVSNMVVKKEKRKNNNELEKKYDFSFMKEYVSLYDLPKNELAKLFMCGVGKIDDILNGVILLNENITEEVCCEFQCKDYDSLKKLINNKIEIKKENLKIKQNNNPFSNPKTKIINLSKVNKNLLLELLDYTHLNHKDLIIMLLLIYDNKNRNISEVSKFLGISEDYIKEIYKENLEKIKEGLLKKDSNIKLVYKKVDN